MRSEYERTAKKIAFSLVIDCDNNQWLQRRWKIDAKDVMDCKYFFINLLIGYFVNLYYMLDPYCFIAFNSTVQ